VEAEYRGLLLRTSDEDPEHEGYFEHASKGSLAVQLCEGCGLLRATFSSACPFCQSDRWRWQGVSGRGTIYSWFVVAQAVHPAFRDWTPYPVILVELEEQRGIPWRDGREGETVSLRVIANLVSPEDSGVPEKEGNIAIGTEVEVCFVPLTEDAALPQFRLLRPAAPAGPPAG
jgi:uncharacterized OB-fold protein